ncbi:hypothetical protein BKA65DRAFT_273215 [Rhexocercosporidium sp. MPI-PUGE-AT-0058]|nr:hypothetical protein BKA65DRAFT_273215 [Rhexocercosporidium sp. MPI-PUGE-AT-0058]
MSSDLDTEQIQALEDEKILLSGTVNGKRKVSAALLSPPSTQGSVSSGSSGSASVRIHSPEHSQAPFDLPESAESVAAVEWCGFARTKSGEIFARWLGRPDPQQNPDGLLQYIIGETTRLNVQPLIDAPVLQAMAALGISDELRGVLTDPAYTQLFMSQTLRFWLEDTIRTRYATLENLLDRLKSRGVETVARRKGGKRAKVMGAFDQSGPSQASSSSKAPSQAQEERSALTSMQSNVLPATYVSVESSPPILQDHYVFYKGKAVGELRSDTFILSDGSINMEAIESYRCGDFNPRKGAWYFTKEEETAEKYRQWAAARAPQAESWIIRIQVPKSFIDGLRKKELWYSLDWKTFVWFCRKGQSAGSPPPKFDAFWRPGQAQLIEGHICASAPASMARMKLEDYQQKLNESKVLYNGNQKATQSVFVDEDAVERMGELIRGKVFIEIFP